MVGLSAWLPELSWITFFASLLLVAQLLATAILLARLIPGMQRPSPLVAQATHPEQLATVSVVVPTLNEVDRLAPCLQGLTLQGYAVREILVVDSQSTDGTQALVEVFMRIQLLRQLMNPAKVRKINLTIIAIHDSHSPG